jgi:secreted trypsin-like serine protease
VLTAASCVVRQDGVTDPAHIFVYITSKSGPSTDQRVIVKAVKTPDAPNAYDPVTYQNNIAVVELNVDKTRTNLPTPMKLNKSSDMAGLVTDSVPDDQQAHIIGFGIAPTSLMGSYIKGVDPEPVMGVRHQASTSLNSIKSIDASWRTNTSEDFDYLNIGKYAATACPGGDFGSPALMKVGAATRETIVGIAVRIAPFKVVDIHSALLCPGASADYLRVDLYQEFLTPFTQR